MSYPDLDRPWIYVAEITRAVDAAGTLVTAFASMGTGFATRPTDTPANTQVPPTLADPGTLRRELFSGNKTFGGARSAFGDVVLKNKQGEYDGWEHDGFNGRPFVLRWGPLGGAYPGDFVTVMVCTMEGLYLTKSEARIRLRDASTLLDKSFLQAAFTGATDAEGLTAGLAGRAKARYIGTPQWLGPAPVLIANGFGKPIYHVSTGHVANSSAFDSGSFLQPDGPVTASEFWEATGGPEQPTWYWTLNENGNVYLRVGSKPAGDLRVSLATKQVGGADWTLAALLAEAGYTGSIEGAPLPVTGIIVDDAGTSYRDVLDAFATQAGMWYGFDRLGHFVSNAFSAPAGAPVLTLNRDNCDSVERAPPDEMPVPLHQLTLNSGKTWRSDYSAPGNFVRNNFEADSWLWRYTYTDPTVLVKHPAAASLHLDVPTYINSAQWPAFRDRYMALFGVDRSMFVATLRLDASTLALDLGQVVRLYWTRFNLAAGRLLRVVALRYAFASRKVEVVLWG